MTRFLPADEIPPDARGGAIAFGKFDGVHIGHQEVLASARAVADRRDAPMAAAVLRPHPRRVFEPNAPPFRLQSRAQRDRALAAHGADHVFEIAFDRGVSQWTDEEFSERVFAQRFGAVHVSVGQHFRFGAGRTGDVESLRRAGEKLGFTTEGVPEVANLAGGKVSSTLIRDAVARGDMAEAQRMLGRPWAIEGQVQRGFQRGRGFGFPTANIPLGDYQRPRLGVYAVRADLGDACWRPGVANIGVNPTLGALPEPVLEAHLFDFDADLYGRTIEVELIVFLRTEETFDSAEAMVRQIERDADQARTLLAKA